MISMRTGEDCTIHQKGHYPNEVYKMWKASKISVANMF